MLLCFLFYYGFFFLSKLFVGNGDDLVQKLGIDLHYQSISRGVIDSRDVVYFLSVIAIFLAGTVASLESRKW